MVSKSAKILNQNQQKVFLSYLETTRNPIRNKVIFLLSHKAGLRSSEIAKILWKMVLDSEGRIADTIHLEDAICKRGSGGVLPIPKDLRMALQALYDLREPSPDHNIIYSEKGRRMTAQSITNFFWTSYAQMGFIGSSSHSGRRYYICQIARKVSLVGGSMVDCMRLARHSSLAMTQRYVDANSDAAKKVVEMI